MKNLILLVCIVLNLGAFAQVFNPISSSTTDLVGLWEFENVGNLVQATVGSDLVVQTGNPSAVGGSVTSVSGATGTDDAVRIPVGTHFKCSHGIAASGGGSFVNLYTIVVDVKIPSVGSWYSLFQTNSINENDGDSFINLSGAVGVYGIYAGSVSAGTWYRIAVVVDLVAGNIKYYIDGTLVNTVSSGTTVDGRYSLNLNMIHFFADQNGEDGQLDVSTIALFDDALSAAEVAALGGVLGTPACALAFDGTNDYVDCGSAINIANQSFTIEFWAKQDDYGENYIIYQGSQAVNGGLHIGFRNASQFTFAFYGNDLDVSGVDLQWHHWACVYEANTGGTDRFIYKDGTLVGSDDANGNFTGSGVFELGRRWASGYFNGQLDEVRVWNTARSSTEINAYKDCELIGNETGLLAYYKFNQGITNNNNSSETTLNDATSNNNNGTLTNFTLSGSTSNWTSSCGVTSGSICTPLLGSSGNPFTSLDQATTVTSAGIYYFNIGGNTFDTYVDANGFVQVAIDFGNGVGDLPQGTSLTTATRGILNPTILATLTETSIVRISSSTGNFDVTSTDATIISRVQSNTSLHKGVADNTINDSWTGTNAIYITADATCPSSFTSLHQGIAHGCGNGDSFHWLPFNNEQKERFTDGEIPDAAFLQLWVKGTVVPLPVELIYFQGKANDNQIQLNWETASELNNSGFEIHKSNNGKDWETIDFVVGQGTTLEVSTYQYEDQKPLIGANYYRLKQIDFDGAFEYSKVIAVEYNIEESNIIIFPNPSNGVVNLQINNPSNQKMQIKILDNLGRIIRDSEIIEGEANWQQEMVIKEKGIYTVAIQIGNEIIYKRIVIAD